MGTLEIEKRVRIVRASHGRGKEVILPYAVYRDLMELKTTMEILERTEVQQSLRKGRMEVAEGRTKSFRNATQAVKWLNKLKALGNTLNCLQRLAIFCILTVCVSPVFAQDSTDVDHSAVLEVGAAGERDLKSNTSNFGATLAVEMTPVEHWLELEFGVSALGTSGQTELAADLLFKKPYRLSRTAEFMFGVGFEVVRQFSDEEPSTSLGVEAVLDFMFWPTNNIGWYLEPAYDLVPGKGAEQSLGMSAGVLIGWP